MPENATPTAGPAAAPSPAVAPAPPPGFELLGEIGHGGMGVVYRAHDFALGRDVAVKLLHSRFAPDSAAARRFRDEARITGQLQHPAIPAVHQVGALPDGRPFLAMRLIKGRTLEELLKGRSDSVAEHGRLLAVFEHACQAVAYAHAHQVLHRDLKPSNVMVGAFGEVQVMDWGLAKVLGSRLTSPAADSDATVGTEIRLTPGLGDATQAGSLLGTPAYMSPEQAIGAVDAIDARSDVFGLGGILCAILTGKPPYAGSDPESTRQLAARAKLEGALARLEACGADPGLLALCQRCLAAEPAARPADAGEVAAAVAELRSQAEQRARQAELERVRAEGERAKAEAEARAQRQKRRLQLALAAGLLALLVLGGGAWLAVRSEAESRQADADRTASVALGRAEQLAAEAEARDPGTVAEAKATVGLWEQAEAAVLQAEAAATSGNPDVVQRVAEAAVAIRDGLAKARRDAALLKALELVKATPHDSQGGWRSGAKKVRLFRAALAAAGLPSRLPQKGDAVTTVGVIRAERKGVRTALRATLDHLLTETPPWEDLHDGFEFAGWLEVANRCDDHPFRREARRKCHGAFMTILPDVGGQPAPHAPPPPDPPVRKEDLLRLVERAEAEAAPTDTVVMLGKVQIGLWGGPPDVHLLRLLRKARDRNPADWRLLEVIAFSARDVWEATGDPRAAEESLGCFRTIIALLPDNMMGYCELGTLLTQYGDEAKAIPYLREAISRNPTFTFARINLACAQYQAEDPDGADKTLRETIKIDPTFAAAHFSLGNVRWARGDFQGAVKCFLRAYECAFDPGDRLVCYMAALRRTGRFDQTRQIARKWQIQAKKNDPRRVRVAAALKTLERAVAAEAKLSAVLAGGGPPADSQECLLLAERCACLAQDAAAARLYAAAFAGDPALAAFTYRVGTFDVFIAPDETSNRYSAALAAARAGCWPAEGRPQTSAARAALRKQALEWLRAELAVLRKQAASPIWREKLAVAVHLPLWLVEPALAGLRPGRAQAKLPTSERAAWGKLWDEVRDTIVLARHPPPPSVKP
jgi:tetratricopeptide (TPR) repeat protein